MASSRIVRPHAALALALGLGYGGTTGVLAQDASGLRDADALVVIGAGAAGPWVTEYELANPDAAPIQALIGPAPFAVPCPPLQACEQAVGNSRTRDGESIQYPLQPYVCG